MVTSFAVRRVCLQVGVGMHMTKQPRAWRRAAYRHQYMNSRELCDSRRRNWVKMFRDALSITGAERIFRQYKAAAASSERDFHALGVIFTQRRFNSEKLCEGHPRWRRRECSAGF